MRPHFGALVHVASAGLRDSSARVRAEALDAVSTLVQWVGEEPEVRLFRELVPSLLQVGHPSPPQHKNCSSSNVPVSASVPYQRWSCIDLTPSFTACSALPNWAI